MDKKDGIEKAADEPDDDLQDPEPANEDAPMPFEEPDPNKASYHSSQVSAGRNVSWLENVSLS
jgi:hypothetical protein